MATPRDIERRLDAVDAKLPQPRDEALTEIDQWLATLSNDALEWLQGEYRRGAAPTTRAEGEQISEIVTAITEERFCPIGSDPVSRWNWRWRAWRPGDPLPRAETGQAPAPAPEPAPEPPRREVRPTDADPGPG